MARPLDIACLQTRPMPDFQSALDEAMPLAEAAAKAGADILFLPEYCGGLKTEGAAVAPPSAPRGDASVSAKRCRISPQTLSVWINLGSIAVDAPDGRILNRGLMIDDTGAIRGRYDKINMFDIQLSETEVYRESATVSPRHRSAVIHDTPFARIGHTICYDLRFPELFRDAGAGWRRDPDLPGRLHPQNRRGALACPQPRPRDREHLLRDLALRHWRCARRRRMLSATRWSSTRGARLSPMAALSPASYRPALISIWWARPRPKSHPSAMIAPSP